MVEIREMTIDDIDPVAEIEKENFSLPWDQVSFFTYLFREGTFFYVAAEDEKILGYVGMITAADEGDITMVSVSGEARNRGIGNMLMEKLIKEAEFNGIAKIFLEVRPSNASALALYRRHGFEQISVRKNYYEAPAEDALVMMKKL